MSPTQLSDFNPISDHRPLGPSKETGYRISPTKGNSNDDEAHYILKPDAQFLRPWLGSPQGKSGVAFIWPLGIEGFSYTSNAQAGIHHYIGDNDVDVDIVYPDELHIVLSGSFPGKNSVQNKIDLMNVILAPTDQQGKLLGLPGIEKDALYVAVLNYQFTHDQQDTSHSIAYSIELIKIGQGGRLPRSQPPSTPTENPTQGKADKGKSPRRTRTKGKSSTLRGAATEVYGGSGGGNVMKLMSQNVQDLDAIGIPDFKAPYVRLPPGTVLKF